ncbi:MAG TPA: helix-turn-helix transcriptional regulator [Armatimonadota bacterium]|nr:helix-turn-helix transcriptional regulator [Armatimonadota bacterium]
MRHQSLHCLAGIKMQPVGYQFTTTAYDHLQVIYIREGCLHFFSPDTWQQTLSTGDGVILRIGSRFRLSCPDVGYAGVGINVFDEAQPEYRGISVPFHANQSVRELAMLMSREIDTPAAGTPQVMEGLGMAMVWQALRQVTSPPDPLDTTREWAERAQQTILATLTTGRGVREALASLPLSYRQLARHFFTNFGLSPKQYQQQCRLQEVKRLLLETQLSVTTIAHELGYPSSQHLSAQFHQMVGMSPQQYRQSRYLYDPSA